jgi:hypothetical protein
LAQLLFEVCYFIAQPRREFELQIGCRGMHLSRQLLDEIGEIASGESRQLPRLRSRLLRPE